MQPRIRSQRVSMDATSPPARASDSGADQWEAYRPHSVPTRTWDGDFRHLGLPPRAAMAGMRPNREALVIPLRLATLRIHHTNNNHAFVPVR